MNGLYVTKLFKFPAHVAKTKIAIKYTFNNIISSFVKNTHSKPFISRKCSTGAHINNSSNKMVGYWLLGCSGMVWVAVTLGGVTRLTESGLSMVTWKVLGEKMPKNEQDWVEEFAKYQQFPEYTL